MSPKPPFVTGKERLITEVQAIRGGFLLVKWDHGAMGFVDLRGVIDSLPVFEFLKDDQAFKEVRIAEDGSSVYWIDHEGDTIDLDSETLWFRRKPISAKAASQGSIGSRALSSTEA